MTLRKITQYSDDMKLIIISLALGAVLLTTPAYAAESESGATSLPEALESFDLDRVFEDLRRLLWRAEAEVRDRVELKRDMQAQPDGEQQRHFEFKFYPKGRSQSDEHIKAETWVGSLDKSDESDFQFRLRFKRDRDKPPSQQ